MTSNALATRGAAVGLRSMANLDAAPDDLIERAGAELGIGAQNKYLKFSGKSGYFTFDGKPLENGSQILIDFFETEKGFICYQGGKVQGRVSQKLLDRNAPALPTDDELHEIFAGPFDKAKGEGWKSFIQFNLNFLDTGKPAVISFSSYSQLSAAKTLLGDWYAEAKQRVDENGEPLWPLVELSSEMKGKAPETYYVPKFKLVNWTTLEELEIELGAAKEAPKPAPKAAAPAARPRAGGGFGSGVRGARA